MSRSSALHTSVAPCSRGSVALALHWDLRFRSEPRVSSIEPRLDRVELREVVHGVASCKSPFPCLRDTRRPSGHRPLCEQDLHPNLRWPGVDEHLLVQHQVTRKGSTETVTKEGTFLADMSEGADDGDKRKESLSDLVFWTLYRRDESRGSQSRWIEQSSWNAPRDVQGDLE